MYEAHWKISRRPFEEEAAPEFFYPSRTHQAGLLKLRYLIEQRKGIGLLVGEHGLGKSFLTHVLESELTENGLGVVIRLVFPQLSPAGTMAYFASRLGVLASSEQPEEQVLRHLEDRLVELRSSGQHVTFVIDDAHLLDLAHLQTLRLLLNLREAGRADFSLVLSGRTELLSKLQRLGALDQRIVVRAALEPLAREEVLPYVQQRLSVAGRDTNLFNLRSAQTLWELSQGIPRRINQLCDLSLLVGFVDNRETISAVEIEAAAEELMSTAA
ncbi:ExeA family protein [Planctomicrobium sp. SH664]|uniref:ExeA family protein n=1 Tax=Planctomicrobium sp. SH664 TaxID=3448125 RepID=UPI003F5AF31D